MLVFPCRFFVCWAFFVFWWTTSKVDINWKWVLFFRSAPSKSQKRPAPSKRKEPSSKKNPDVVSFAGCFSEGGRKIFRLPSGLRAHDSRNILHLFVGKAPSECTHIRVSFVICWTLGTFDCRWAPRDVHSAQERPALVKTYSDL